MTVVLIATQEVIFSAVCLFYLPHRSYQNKHDNIVKHRDTLHTMLDRKKEEFDQQLMRNEELASLNQEQALMLRVKVYTNLTTRTDLHAFLRISSMCLILNRA